MAPSQLSAGRLALALLLLTSVAAASSDPLTNGGRMLKDLTGLNCIEEVEEPPASGKFVLKITCPLVIDSTLNAAKVDPERHPLTVLSGAQRGTNAAAAPAVVHIEAQAGTSANGKALEVQGLAGSPAVQIDTADEVGLTIPNSAGLVVTGASTLGVTSVTSPDDTTALKVTAGPANGNISPLAAEFVGTASFTSQSPTLAAVVVTQGDMELQDAASDLVVKGTATMGPTTIRSTDATTTLRVLAGQGPAVAVVGVANNVALAVTTQDDATTAIKVQQGITKLLQTGVTASATTAGTAFVVQGDGSNPAVVISSESDAAVALQVNVGLTSLQGAKVSALESGSALFEGNVVISGTDNGGDFALMVEAGSPAKFALGVEGQSQISGKTVVEGETEFTGPTRVTGPFRVNGRCDIEGTVEIYGSATIQASAPDVSALSLSAAELPKLPETQTVFAPALACGGKAFFAEEVTVNADLYVKGNGWAAAWQTYRPKANPTKPHHAKLHPKPQPVRRPGYKRS